MTFVPPDGPVPCEFAVVGEGPASEEVRLGRGFVGPSGALLWPLMWKQAQLQRRECYVTNLSKEPLDNDLPGEDKLSPADFWRCQQELLAELDQVRPSRILAVGALAAKALLGDRYTNMTACNGIGFTLRLPSTPPNAADRPPPRLQGVPPLVVPTWHPAAALRGAGEKDSLAFTAAAIGALRDPPVQPRAPIVPVAQRWAPLNLFETWGGRWGCDTEGTPEDPICMTVSNGASRWYVEPEHVADWFSKLQDSAELVFHNAPWDWEVLWAMGAPEDLPERWAWRDTMELAYLRQTEPQGLKDLAWRHLGLKMTPFEELVQPYQHEVAQAIARGIIGADTTLVDKKVTFTVGHKTHSAKTGKPFKKPRPVRDFRIETKAVLGPVAKPLFRALGNPELLLKRLGPAAPELSLRLVPEAARIEYATLDAWATVKLEAVLDGRVTTRQGGRYIYVWGTPGVGQVLTEELMLRGMKALGIG